MGYQTCPPFGWCCQLYDTLIKYRLGKPHLQCIVSKLQSIMQSNDWWKLTSFFSMATMKQSPCTALTAEKCRVVQGDCETVYLGWDCLLLQMPSVWIWYHQIISRQPLQKQWRTMEAVPQVIKIINKCHRKNSMLYSNDFQICFYDNNKTVYTETSSWWCCDTEVLCVLLPLWERYPLVDSSTVDSPHKGPVMQIFNFIVSLNKLLKKQSMCWWFALPWSSCDFIVMQEIICLDFPFFKSV